MIKTYSELTKLNSFDERIKYLMMNGIIGDETFGCNRYLNQSLYHSEEWRNFRRQIIIRDNGCDLGLEDRPIISNSLIIIHHINPLTKSQILNRDKLIFDPENVISCVHRTHMAIHYGSIDTADCKITIRTRNDTCPWKR